jgi:hypothetical protein
MIIQVFWLLVNLSVFVCGVKILRYNNNIGSTSEHQAPVSTFLQQEQILCVNAQQQIVNYLRQKGIPLGSGPGVLRAIREKDDSINGRVTTSRSDNDIECRITLGKAPIGARCISPCSCTGSQKWVQFSVLNRLRRKIPSEWKTCQTCREPYKYHLFTRYGNLHTEILRLLLDKRTVLRGILALFVVALLHGIDLPAILMKVTLSKFVWEQVTILHCISFDTIF